MRMKGEMASAKNKKMFFGGKGYLGFLLLLIETSLISSFTIYSKTFAGLHRSLDSWH